MGTSFGSDFCSFQKRQWRQLATAFGFLVTLIAMALLRQVIACPLCESIGSTFSDDLQAPALGVIVRVTDCETRDDGAGFDLMVDHVATIGRKESLPKFQGVFSFTEIAPGEKLLLIGTPDVAALSTDNADKDDADKIIWLWNTPTELSDPLATYIENLPLGDQSDSDRLEYFYRHLFSSDNQVSDDAYSECARISLDVIRDRNFRRNFDKAHLIATLKRNDFQSRYKSFLWMVLAELGLPSDAGLFDELALPIIIEELKQTDKETISSITLANYPWLAASMACYVRLGGETAFQVLEEKLFRNQECPVSLKSAAISAIRVFGNDLDPTQMTRAAKALSLVLDDPLAADLVIPDLARWEYWDSLESLSTLFHSPQSAEGLARYLIINYMRHCPLPQAAIEIERMKQSDPKSYRRAVAMVPRVERR
ncbi:hypothetical protein SH449x_000961 [Pirellulaceae bacterium SH449]